MSFMTKKFKSLYAFALTVGPFCCIGLVNDWQPGVSMRFSSVKKMLVVIIQRFFSFLLWNTKCSKKLARSWIWKVEHWMQQPRMSCQRTIFQDFIIILDYVVDLTRIINYVNMSFTFVKDKSLCVQWLCTLLAYILLIVMLILALMMNLWTIL